MAFQSQCGHKHETVREAYACWAMANEANGARETARWIGVGGHADTELEKSMAAHPAGSGRQGVEPDEVPDARGVYLHNGEYYKVQKARNSDKLYAKVGVQAQEWVMDHDKGEQVLKAEWRWEYQRGAIFRLRKSEKLTGEQATEFGKLWGVCVNCLKDLTREESMDRAYGPTCAKNNGWPYDYNRRG